MDSTEPGKNNGLQTWTVNQGMILGALMELSKGPLGRDVIDVAAKVAISAIKTMSNTGILVEAGNCEIQNSHCGPDAKQFKGIFIRSLAYLYEAIRNPDTKFFYIEGTFYTTPIPFWPNIAITRTEWVLLGLVPLLVLMALLIVVLWLC
jgi:hypothetical protein